MSLYCRAWAFSGWMLLVFLTAQVWFFGPAERWGPLAALPGAIFWLAHGAATVWAFRCPECGCSAYLIRKGFPGFYLPWPRRRCACCGFDLRH
jgi:hypothetical protein